jgi:hypothetical protein
MASASFTLRAVDQTRAAFASAQNSLTKITTIASRASASMVGFFGFQAAIGGVTRLNAAMEEAEKSGKSLGLAADQIDSLTRATNLLDEAGRNIKLSLAGAVNAVAPIFNLGKDEGGADLIATRLERAKPQLDDINKKLAEQRIANDLIGASDRKILQNLQDQVILQTNKIKMSDDIVERAQAELDESVALGRVKSQIFKMDQDKIDLDQENLQIRQALNSAIGIEPDIVKRSNILLQDRFRISELIRLNQDKSLEGLEREDQLRASRNAVNRELIPLLEQRYELEKGIGVVIADNFQTAVLEGGRAIDIVREMVKEIIRMIFYQTVTKRIASSITGALIGNPLVGTSIGEAIKVPQNAGGGPVSANSLHLVGERGPELFVSGSSGSIVPNSRINAQDEGTKGSTVNITYQIQSGVSRAELVPILDQERRRLKAEIPDMVRRGGAYRAAFA